MKKKDSRNESGQAIVEYIVVISIALMITGILAVGFSRIYQFLWKKMVCEVAAGCPTCPAPQEVKDMKFPGNCR